MNQTDYNGLSQQMKSMISDYRKDVIEQKYSNNIAELQSLLERLRKLTDEYFKSNQRNFTKEVMERVDSEVKEAIDYINLIASETAEFIRKDNTLPEVAADVLLSQNNYIKNLSLRDEITRQMSYYEKASLKVRTEYKNKTEAEFQERFAVLENAEGRKKYIVKECAETYQKLSKMKKDLNFVLRNDLKQIRTIYDRYLKEMPSIDLGDIVTQDIDPSLRLLSDEEVRKRAQDILKQVHSFDKFEGVKRKFHFTFEGHDYGVIVPVGKKGEFLKCLEQLAGLRDVLKERENMNQYTQTTTAVGFQEDYIDISIDRATFETMTLQQKLSYLQSLMLRIENQKSDQVITVKDANDKEKMIPAYYFNVYLECLNMFHVLTTSIDLNYLDSLPFEDKIRYCQIIMEKIRRQGKEPFVTLPNGEQISAQYYQSYVEAKKLYQELIQSRAKIDAQSPDLIEDNTTKREYMIDESYVKELPLKLQLSYYANLIGKIATSNIVPVVVYESFGIKLNIPVNLVTTVQECERRALEIKETLKFVVDPSKVQGKTPEMQFGYYTNLIEKMRHSNKTPKVVVDAFGESIEIPSDYLNYFQECVKQIEMLKARFELQNKTYIKVEKVRKPMTQKVKEYFKNISTRVKVALGFAAITAATITGLGIGKAKTTEDAATLFKAANQSTISAEADVPVDDISDSTNDTNADDDLVNDWVKSANQTMASRLGGTVYLNQDQIYTSFDSEKALSTHGSVKDSNATIVAVSIKTLDGTMVNINFTEMDAQARIDELVSQGGVIERVGVVSEVGEQSFKQTGHITGFIKVDENTDFTRAGVTNLSQEIQAMLNQGRSL